MQKIEKKHLIVAGVAILAIALVGGYLLRQKMNAKPAPLTKLTGTIESIANDKSSLTLKTDTLTYTADVTAVKTTKNNAGEKISINDIKVGDQVELRTRTSLKDGKTVEISAYSIKDLSVLGTEKTDSKK
ncbi:MAG: hypothetical protein WA064_00270 [Candidatus Moraniibacteriota bacterium]